MPIEFRCVTCQKLLRVGNDAAGKKARCPDCGTIQEVRSGAGMDPPTFPGRVSPTPFGPPAQPANPPPNPFAEQAPAGQPFGPTANPYMPSQIAGAPLPLTWATVQAKVSAPAMAMLIVAGITIFLQILAVAGMVVVVAVGNGRMEDFVTNIVSGILGLGISTTIAIGAAKMRRVENYGLAVTAAVLSMLPCSGCCLLSLPFGIWALIVLLDPAVKEAFH